MGELFALIHQRGNAICLRAEMEGADEEEDQRFVPLLWPGNDASVGIAVQLNAMHGNVLSLPGARLDVDPLSACDGSEGTPLDVFQSDRGLHFPIVNLGNIHSFVNAETGTIVSTRGAWLAYRSWRITVPNDTAERKQILGSETAPVGDD